MTLTATGSAKAKAFPSNGRISNANGGKLTISLRSVAAAASAYVGIGVTNPGPPATYADVDGDVGAPVASLPADESVQYVPADGSVNVSISMEINPGAFTLADNVWVAVFDGLTATPGPTDVPDAVVGPFTVSA